MNRALMGGSNDGTAARVSRNWALFRTWAIDILSRPNGSADPVLDETIEHIRSTQIFPSVSMAAALIPRPWNSLETTVLARQWIKIRAGSDSASPDISTIWPGLNHESGPKKLPSGTNGFDDEEKGQIFLLAKNRSHPFWRNIKRMFDDVSMFGRLKDLDRETKLNTIKNLPKTASDLGPEQTRTRLMGYLCEWIADEDDEILAVLGKVLGTMSECVGTDHIETLFGPLELLCGSEEPQTREHALESLKQLTDLVQIHQIEDKICEIIRRLGTSSWFTSRQSSTVLVSMYYEKVSETRKNELIDMFLHLVNDHTPMVRRSVATQLSKIVFLMDWKQFMERFYGSLLALSGDDQDSVRPLLVEIMTSLGSRMNKDVDEWIWPIIRNLFKDASWRVRYMISKHFPVLYTQHHHQHGQELMVEYTNLLGDETAETRAMASSKLGDVCVQLTKDQIVDQMIPRISDLTSDDCAQVRLSVGLQIDKVGAVVGADMTKSTIIPMLIKLLKDEDPSVRLGTLDIVESMIPIIGIELVTQCFLPVIVDLSQDPQWRIRSATVSKIPIFAKHIGVELYSTTLNEMCMSLICDKVYSVRMMTIDILVQIGLVFGEEWVTSYVFPRMTELSSMDNYLYRVTSLFLMRELARILDGKTVVDCFLPILGRMACDRVPNVRLNVAKTLGWVVPRLIEHGCEEFRKGVETLLELQNDTDCDVIQQAKCGQETIKDLQNEAR